VPRIRISYNAPVVLTFALLAVGVFVLGEVVSKNIIANYFVAKPYLHSTGDYLGLVTHILGHKDWNHLLGNFMLILLLGPLLEERFGSTRLLGMIIVTALATGLINLAFLDTGLLGASGIVFMMILLASTANIRQGAIPLTFLAVAFIYLGGEIVRAIGKEDGVSQMGHLCGGITGAVFGFLAAKAKGTTVAAELPTASAIKQIGASRRDSR
jgi:rhomboid protease GluP